jgi:hypothetical protein
MTLCYMPYLATGLVTLLLSLPALSVELFRYRGQRKMAALWNTSFRPVNRILPMQ